MSTITLAEYVERLKEDPELFWKSEARKKKIQKRIFGKDFQEDRFFEEQKRAWEYLYGEESK